MDIDTLEDLAKELKNDENENVLKLFQQYAAEHKMKEDELEQILSKKHDCFYCESCERFFTYEEYSLFDDKCTYCCDVEEEEF